MKATTEVLKSSHLTQVWNASILLRLDKLITEKQAFFKRKGIETLPDLLKRIGIRDDRLPLVLLGFMSLMPIHRERLGDLFDDSHLERTALTKEVEALESQIRMRKQSKTDTFADWQILKSTIDKLEQDLTSKKNALSTVPPRNTLPADIYNYVKPEDLERKGFCIKDKASEIERYFLTSGGSQWFADCKDLRNLVIAETEPSTETLVAMWGRVKTGLKGNLSVRSILASFLGRKES